MEGRADHAGADAVDADSGRAEFLREATCHGHDRAFAARVGPGARPAAVGQGRRVMDEYLSPNTNKPLHLSHLRNGALGMAIASYEWMAAVTLVVVAFFFLPTNAI